ncbi:hypothetical protein GCM10020370_25170 [Paenibacillus hodogayensis]
MNKSRTVVVLMIRGSTIKTFILLDLLLGSGIFYVVKFVAASTLAASIGSYLGTEGIKKAPKFFKR